MSTTAYWTVLVLEVVELLLVVEVVDVVEGVLVVEVVLVVLVVEVVVEPAWTTVIVPCIQPLWNWHS